MSVIDEILKDAMNRGDFDNLPGSGKPLKIEDDANTPQNLRIAHKLLKENDLVPDWIAQGKAIDADYDRLGRDLRSALRKYRGELNDAARSATPAGDRERAEKRHQAVLADLRARAKKLNGQILSYNLKIPRVMAQKRLFDFDRELAAVS